MMSALMLAGCGTVMSSVECGNTAVTVSAAEADYDWGGFLKKSNDWFGTSEAIKIADECIQYQVSGEGGWQKGMLTQHTGDWAHSTIDNDATTSQIRFLMRTYAQTKQQKYFDCAMRGVDCLFKMQYQNGGWMQCLNTPNTYHAHITLNDGAYVHVLNIMDEMSRKAGDFTAVSTEYQNKAAASLQKGIQCLLDMQIKVNGRLTAWCQQHDEHNLAPAGARAYELPSICTSESATILTFLYKYAQDHPERTDIVTSVNAAITWFKKVQLNGIKFVTQGDDKVVVQDANASPLWARFYTLDTEVPMFSDRDGGVYYDVAQISKERRTGYAWYGNWGKNVVGLALLDGTPVAEPEYSGQYISRLVLHDTARSSSWSIQQNLNVGSKVFGDREFTVVTIPTELVGAEYVQPACDSKSYSKDLAELTAASDCTVYAIVDMRLIEEQGISPDWLDGWKQSSEILNISNTVAFYIFSKELQAGETVTLGSNKTAQNVVNYFTAVQPRAEIVTTTTKEVTTTAAETTTTTNTEATTTATTTNTEATTTAAAGTETTSQVQNVLLGDVNCNDNVDVSDAVLLARYLGEDTDAAVSAQGKLNADCDGNSGLTADDVIMILKYVAKIIDEF